MSTINHSSPDHARELLTAFAAVGPALMKWVAASARHTGVTWARMKTLHALECKGPQIMSSLRDELGVTPRSVTALVDALEADALVSRVPHPTDRRATIVELTEQGRHTIEGLFEAHSDRAAAVFARLDEADQCELLRLLRLLSTALGELHGQEHRLSER